MFYHLMIKPQSCSGPVSLGFDLHKYFLAFVLPLHDLGRLEEAKLEKCPSPRWAKAL